MWIFSSTVIWVISPPMQTIGSYFLRTVLCEFSLPNPLKNDHLFCYIYTKALSGRQPATSKTSQNPYDKADYANPPLAPAQPIHQQLLSAWLSPGIVQKYTFYLHQE